MNVLDKISSQFIKSDVPAFRVGDTIRVHQLIVEGNKERVQVFEGICISRTGVGINEAFIVRKISYNVGIEKTYLINSLRVV